MAVAAADVEVTEDTAAVRRPEITDTDLAGTDLRTTRGAERTGTTGWRKTRLVGRGVGALGRGPTSGGTQTTGTEGTATETSRPGGTGTTTGIGVAVGAGVRTGGETSVIAIVIATTGAKRKDTGAVETEEIGPGNDTRTTTGIANGGATGTTTEEDRWHLHWTQISSRLHKCYECKMHRIGMSRVYARAICKVLPNDLPNRPRLPFDADKAARKLSSPDCVHPFLR